MSTEAPIRERTPPASASGGILRTSVTLIFSNFAGSAIGLLYWIVAARHLDKAQLGLDAVVVNTVTLATTLGSLDLINVVPRYLPAAGRSAARFIGRSYLTAVALSLLVAVIFLLGVGAWSPTLGYLADDWSWTIWFLLAVAAWCVFSLQDCVLIAFRRSQWIPAENITFALVKLAALVVLLEYAPRYAVLLSWALPAVLFVFVVNLGLVRPIVRHETRDVESTLPPARRLVRAAVLGNTSHIAAIIISGSLPLIVTEVLGAEANASYYLAWTMAYVLFLAPRYVALVVLSRAEHEGDSLDELTFRATMAATAVVTVSVLIAVVGAEPLIALVGTDYGSDAVFLLRMMCLAAIPHCVVQMAGSWARGRQRLGLAISITLAEYVLVASLVIGLIGRIGLTALGWAWLIAETAVAAVVAIMAWRGGHINRSMVAELALLSRERVRHRLALRTKNIQR